MMTEYSSANDIPQYSEVIDSCWEEIKSSWEMADFVGMLKAPCKVLARGFFVVWNIHEIRSVWARHCQEEEGCPVEKTPHVALVKIDQWDADVERDHERQV